MKSATKITIMLALALALFAGDLPAQDNKGGDPAGKESGERTERKQEESPAGKADQTKEKTAVRENTEPGDDGAARRMRGRRRAVAERAGAREGQEGAALAAVEIIGFEDEDKDGRNDLFRDANGDGNNDVTGLPYAHDFEFIDENEDEINDVYVDADGDGVNDLQGPFMDLDGDGIYDHVVDSNRDFINDITGLRYNRKSLRGYKFGFIKEERLRMMQGLMDEDLDGILDMHRMRGGGMGTGAARQGNGAGQDMFIDRDGDGIDDRRQPLRGGGMGRGKGRMGRDDN